MIKKVIDSRLAHSLSLSHSLCYRHCSASSLKSKSLLNLYKNFKIFLDKWNWSPLLVFQSIFYPLKWIWTYYILNGFRPLGTLGYPISNDSINFRNIFSSLLLFLLFLEHVPYYKYRIVTANPFYALPIIKYIFQIQANRVTE